MDTLQEQRATLASELASIVTRREPLLEHYTALRSARVRREEIERELRMLAKPIEAHRLAMIKMAMVKEELGLPATTLLENPDATALRQHRYREARREILGQEEGRLNVEIAAMKTTIERVVLLSEELGKLAMDEDNVEFLVEEIQADYNAKAEELRKLDARIELEGGA